MSDEPITYPPLTWRSQEYVLGATNKGELEDGDAFWDSEEGYFKIRSGGEWQPLRPVQPSTDPQYRPLERGARRLITEVWDLIDNGQLNARSMAADAALDLRDEIDKDWMPERKPAPVPEPVTCPGCEGKGWSTCAEGAEQCGMCRGTGTLTVEQVYTLARLVVGAKATGHRVEIGPEDRRSYLGYADSLLMYLIGWLR
jgi:hypothetical protein